MKSEEWGLEPKKKETPGKLTQRRGHMKTQEVTYKLKKETRKKIFSHLLELSASGTLRNSSLGFKLHNLAFLLWRPYKTDTPFFPEKAGFFFFLFGPVV